jgi:hypothetical protein
MPQEIHSKESAAFIATRMSGGTMGALFSGLSMVKLVDFFDLDLSNYSGL